MGHRCVRFKAPGFTIELMRGVRMEGRTVAVRPPVLLPHAVSDAFRRTSVLEAPTFAGVEVDAATWQRSSGAGTRPGVRRAPTAKGPTTHAQEGLLYDSCVGILAKDSSASSP